MLSSLSSTTTGGEETMAGRQQEAKEMNDVMDMMEGKGDAMA